VDYFNVESIFINMQIPSCLRSHSHLSLPSLSEINRLSFILDNFDILSSSEIQSVLKTFLYYPLRPSLGIDFSKFTHFVQTGSSQGLYAKLRSLGILVGNIRIELTLELRDYKIFRDSTRTREMLSDLEISDNVLVSKPWMHGGGFFQGILFPTYPRFLSRVGYFVKEGIQSLVLKRFVNSASGKHQTATRVLGPLVRLEENKTARLHPGRSWIGVAFLGLLITRILRLFSSTADTLPWMRYRLSLGLFQTTATRLSGKDTFAEKGAFVPTSSNCQLFRNYFH